MCRPATLLLLLLTGCYYDIEPILLERDASVPDLAIDLTRFDATGDGFQFANGQPPFHQSELTEAPLDRWGAVPIAPLKADPTTATRDATRDAAGAASLLLTTSNPTAGLFYPATRDADYGLTPYLYVRQGLRPEGKRRQV